MAYDRYTDSNGVNWTLAPPDASQWFIVAYVADTEQRAYDPAPPDMMASMPKPEDTGRYGPGYTVPTAEQSRVIFLDMVSKIDQFAKDHRNQVVLRVTAHNQALGWLVAALFIAAIAEEL